MSAAKNILEMAGEARVLDISGRTSNGAAKVPAGRDRAMPGKMSVKFLSIAVAASCTLVLRAANLPVPVSSEVGTGFWMENFAAATNLAHATSAPLVLFWGNKGCTYCGYLEEAVNTKAFKTWQKAHADYIYCYVQGVNGTDVAPNEGSDVRQFVRSAAGTLSSSKYITAYPIICLYWPQKPGKTKVKSFNGRTGKMLVSATGRTLAQELEDSVTTFFAAYAPKVEIAFGCGEFDGTLGLENRNDRLEAEPSTKRVYVPLVRSGSIVGKVKGTLVVEWPGAIRPVESNAVTWAALETRAYAPVDMALPGGAGFPLGERAVLTLLDDSGAPVATNAIAFVGAKSNTNTNPYWIGERDVDTLGLAEWTHDYELVRAKVAAGKADYTLALFSGTLWCPYCRGIDESLFQSEEFKAWCEANRVQVALFDQAQLPANGGGSQLLTYIPSVEHIANKDVVTGASYLSRHGLRDDADDVVNVRERTASYSTVKWLTPETTSVRLGNPTVLLIDANDNVVGRFNAWRDRNRELGHALGNKYYEPSENLARLDDLLALASRGSERQDYASTTTSELKLGGSVVSSFQVNDARDHYLLKPSSRGKLVVSVNDKTAERQVRLALVRDGVETAVSTDGKLTVDITRAELAAKRLVLRASAPEFTDMAANTRFGAGTPFDATLKSTFKQTLDEATVYTFFDSSATLSSYVVTNGEKVVVKLVSGNLPKGVTLAWDEKTSSVVVKGTASATGKYSFTYKVTIKNAAKTETILTDKASASVAASSPSAINPYYGRAFVTSMPIYTTDMWGVKTLASCIRISLTSKNSLSVKRFAQSSLSFSGEWKKLNTATGVLSTSLKSGKTKVSITLSPAGRLSASIGGDRGTVSLATDYTRFAGSYTVTMPVAETTAGYYTFGAGFLTLKAKTLNRQKGLFDYAGALPNGVAVSGSAYLGGEPGNSEFALLPIYKRSSRKLSNGSKKYKAYDDLVAVLRIQADGRVLYTDPERNRIVLAPDGVSALWRRSTSAADNALEAAMSVFGGYYEPGLSLNKWLALFGLGTEKDLLATVDGAKASAVWKFSRETGVITGTAKGVVDRRTVTAPFKGVVLPGWIDCGCGDELPVRPFAAGTFYYSNQVNGFATPASLEFNLHAP